MKLIFEESREGRGCSILPPCDVPEVSLGEYERKQELHLPELAETDISRHYTTGTLMIRSGALLP